MTHVFQVGDMIRLSGVNSEPGSGFDFEEHIEAVGKKTAVITRVDEDVESYPIRVRWEHLGEDMGYHHSELLLASVIYSEDHLKDKDVL